VNDPTPLTRRPEYYVHGNAAVVVVPQRVAAWLEQRGKLTDLRVQCRGLDPEVDAVLVALRVSALSRRTGGGTRTVTAAAPTAEPAARSQMTTSDVAAAVGISERAVRAAIHRGRLRADQVGGRWLIARRDFEGYRAARRAA